MGVNLVNSVMSYSKASIVVRDAGGKITSIKGILPQILKNLEWALNFSTTLVAPPDSKWGTRVNATWNGIVGQLVRREADLSSGGLSQSPERGKAVDFSTPVIDYINTLIAPVPKQQATVADKSVHTESFTPRGWIGIVATLTTLALGFLVIVKQYVESLYILGRNKALILPGQRN